MWLIDGALPTDAAPAELALGALGDGDDEQRQQPPQQQQLADIDSKMMFELDSNPSSWNGLCDDLTLNKSY